MTLTKLSFILRRTGGTRIELRQIGVRDEAKMLGGIGGCGRPLCCATFLGDFEPVSIRMAKDQNLSLNPAKISGVCGRLMCCLKYENDVYCSGACGRCVLQRRVRQKAAAGARGSAEGWQHGGYAARRRPRNGRQPRYAYCFCAAYAG